MIFRTQRSAYLVGRRHAGSITPLPLLNQEGNKRAQEAVQTMSRAPQKMFSYRQGKIRHPREGVVLAKGRLKGGHPLVSSSR